MAQRNIGNISPEVLEEIVRRTLTSLSQEGGTQPTSTKRSEKLTVQDYPLGTKRTDLVKSATGLALDDITLEKATSQKIEFGDIRINPETLEYQAQIAESSGRYNLAVNLRRAAELTQIPDERVMDIYNSLRPYRCTKQELNDIAHELESKYNAKTCASLVREAADIYEKRGRLKQ